MKTAAASRTAHDRQNGGERMPVKPDESEQALRRKRGEPLWPNTQNVIGPATGGNLPGVTHLSLVPAAGRHR
jgi:hypothetical protein